MTKAFIIFGLAAVLLFIAACAQNSIEASPIAENKTETELAEIEKNPCEGIVCGDNEQCADGKCRCKDNYKACNGECIPKTDCCSDNDCAEGKLCEGQKCISPVCDYNEHFDKEKGECACEEGTKFCDEQKKCIPRDNCCELLSCGRDFRCTRTSFSPTICLANSKKTCKVVHEDREDLFTLEGSDYRIKVEDVMQRGSINLTVNSKIVELGSEETKEISSGVKLFAEDIVTFGGVCKEEPD